MLGTQCARTAVPRGVPARGGTKDLPAMLQVMLMKSSPWESWLSSWV